MIYEAKDENVIKAANLLLNGEVIVYPTDTLYGFGVDATNEDAINKLNKLPQDKFIYSSTHNRVYNKKFKKGNYHLYHHVSGTYILHKNIIDRCVSLYSEYLKLIDKKDIWTDQVILTLIYRDNKELFYRYCDGYGSIIRNLF